MLKNKKIFVFDMDGTIYLGEKILPNAVELISKINSGKNKRIVYFTNNASKNPAHYLEKLNRLGFDASENQILTSADILIKFLKLHRKNKKIYLLGTPELKEMFEQNGITLTSDTPDITVTSFDTTLTYDKLAEACNYIRNGCEWLTTHPDINCPVENGYIPDCGAINELIRASTGRELPKAFGKPSGEVVKSLEEIYSEKRENMVIFGDRLYTDIALGKKNGMTAVLLLTGEATLEEALALPEDLRPDIICKDLSEAEKYIF
ncbi:MAG: HAD-IIA family hydrolase [Oscillospiraceae bacterium]|nr:HAD-IIA family hydrolase [Oscillospiraceae bacterium]